MNIGFLTPELPVKNLTSGGGIGTSVWNLAKTMSKIANVTVFVYQQAISSEFEYEGVKVISLEKKKYPYLGFYFYRKYLNKVLNEKVEELNIQILEVPDWTGILAFMKFKRPVVVKLHGTDAYFCHLENRKQKKKNFYFEKLGFNNATSIISVSNFTAKVTKEIFQLDKNIKVIPNGIDLSKFNNSSPQTYSKKTIVYYGTLIRKKGMFQLVKIFNELYTQDSEIKLILLGADSFDIQTGAKSTWELMKKELSPSALKNVDYLGKISYEELTNWIKKAHVCFFPSLAETFGMVTIEAMAMKKLTVTSDFGWSNEIIEHNLNGFLVNPNDTNECVKLIQEILKLKDVECITNNARKKIESVFDIDKIAHDTLNHYKKLI